VENFHPHRLRATLACAIEDAYDGAEGTWTAGKVLGHQQPEEKTVTKRHYTKKKLITPDVTHVAVDLLARSAATVDMPQIPKTMPEKPKRIRRKR